MKDIFNDMKDRKRLMCLSKVNSLTLETIGMEGKHCTENDDG
jgi:hypothetical protein